MYGTYRLPRLSLHEVSRDHCLSAFRNQGCTKGALPAKIYYLYLLNVWRNRQLSASILRLLADSSTTLAHCALASCLTPACAMATTSATVDVATSITALIKWTPSTRHHKKKKFATLVLTHSTVVTEIIQKNESSTLPLQGAVFVLQSAVEIGVWVTRCGCGGCAAAAAAVAAVDWPSPNTAPNSYGGLIEPHYGTPQ